MEIPKRGSVHPTTLENQKVLAFARLPDNYPEKDDAHTLPHSNCGVDCSPLDILLSEPLDDVLCLQPNTEQSVKTVLDDERLQSTPHEVQLIVSSGSSLVSESSISETDSCISNPIFHICDEPSPERSKPLACANKAHRQVDVRCDTGGFVNDVGNKEPVRKVPHIPTTDKPLEKSVSSTSLSPSVPDKPKADNTEGVDLKEKATHRPGVILLGRGNSFSLGRSEVIFLHNSRPARQKSTKQKLTNTLSHLGHDRNHLSSISDCDESSNASTVASPPHLSTSGLVHPGVLSNYESMSNTVDRLDGVTSSPAHCTTTERGSSLCESLCDNPNIFEDSIWSRSRDHEGEKSAVDHHLDTLWARAEKVMVAKQKVVLEVLEQFGVASGDTDSSLVEEEEDEERIWNIVETKVDALTV